MLTLVGVCCVSLDVVVVNCVLCDGNCSLVLFVVCCVVLIGVCYRCLCVVC